MSPGQITNKLLAAKRQAILDLASRYGAKNVRIFGSYARGDTRPDSDVDLLVDFEQGRSLLDLVHLQEELGTLLGKHVDIAEPKGLHWYLRAKVMDEAVPL